TLRDDVRHHFGRLATCVRDMAGLHARLHELGLGPKAPTWSEGISVLKRARSVSACPQVPAQWLVDDPRLVAEACVQLDRLTRQCRQVRSNLPEFAPERLRELNLFSFSDPALPQIDRLVHFPTPGVGTLRELQQRLVQVTGKLMELQRGAAAVESALKRL